MTKSIHLRALPWPSRYACAINPRIYTTPAESCPSSPSTSHLPPPQPFNDSKDRHRPRSPATKTKHGNSFSASSPCRRFSKEYCTDFLAALKMSPAFASKLPYTTPAIKHIRYDSLLRLSYTHRHIECVRASLSLAEADDM